MRVGRRWRVGDGVGREPKAGEWTARWDIPGSVNWERGYGAHCACIAVSAPQRDSSLSWPVTPTRSLVGTRTCDCGASGLRRPCIQTTSTRGASRRRFSRRCDIASPAYVARATVYHGVRLMRYDVPEFEFEFGWTGCIVTVRYRSSFPRRLSSPAPVLAARWSSLLDDIWKLKLTVLLSQQPPDPQASVQPKARPPTPTNDLVM